MRRSSREKEDPASCGVVESIAPESIAEELGILPGDCIIAINGHRLRDVIDYQFYGSEESLVIATSRGGQEIVYKLERDYEEDLGIQFTEPTFDGIRRCRCHCSFCFVHQMPPGLRSTLYVRDDDYRHSFLFGNFITMTNLTEEDWARLAEQRLSPLYVSVHAADPDLRARLMGAPVAGDILPQLRRLGEIGIQAHTQIVVVPGINDGEALSQTIADLAGLYPVVQSIAVVPVGLTRHRQEGLRTLTPQECADIAQRLLPQQANLRSHYGIGLVYLADEIYLQAGLPIPPAERYDGFPHLENGVGLVRQLLDEWDELRQRVAAPQQPAQRRVTAVSGALIAPILGDILDEMSGLTGVDLQLVPIINELFGPTVTVSGLLGGRDLLDQLQGRDLGDHLVLPRIMFNEQGDRTLDDITVEQIEQRLGVRVALAASLEEILRLP